MLKNEGVVFPGFEFSSPRVPRETVRSFAMLDDVINNPDLNRYLTSAFPGKISRPFSANFQVCPGR